MSIDTTRNAPIAPNATRLLWAGSAAIFAAGVGFAVRGGIFDNWAGEFGFTAGQLGNIGAMGLIGFCFGIIIVGLLVDKIGYGVMVGAAFAFHVLSAFVTFGATNPQNAYGMLSWGMFIFAFANGALEGVANPLVATLYPHNRTHYMNILHASWPAGLVAGSVIGWVLDDKMQVGWKIQLSLYLLPTIVYGVMFLGQAMPKSEAAQKGAKFSEMFKDVGILGAAVVCYLFTILFAGPMGLSQNVAYIIGGVLLIVVGVITKFSLGSFLLFILFVAHALVGAVELGTDGWVQNITGNLFTSEKGKFLFIWTSSIMFCLRFCAHFIEKTLKISPVALLLICAILGVTGLQLASGMQTFTMALIALGIYAVGKSFFWPTMLAVASDRFPRTGAIAISIMGGIGMLSGGLVGSAGLGYSKDRYTAETLQASNPAAYAEAKAATPSKFLFLAEVTPVDGAKLAAAKAAATKTPAQAAMVEADQQGDRKTLKADSFLPMGMATIYLVVLIYFKSIGGYRAVRIEEQDAKA